MLKAIETTYNSYKFRSRIEARWAVFFDTLGICYEYEKEGFDLGHGMYYLPDFWLPEHECYIEIKGAEPTIDEDAKAARLAEHSGKPVYTFWGEVGSFADNNASLNGGMDYDHWWCECPICGKYGITLNGRAGRLPCQCVSLLVNPFSEWQLENMLQPHIYDRLTACDFWQNPDKCYNYSTPGLMVAYNVARGARFEHGENGHE